MICYPLSRPDTTTYRNVMKWLRRLKVPIRAPTELTKLVLLANGSPDDIVVTILAHKLDGREVVGIVKPERYLRESVIRELLSLIPHIPFVKRVVVVIDQERKRLEELRKDIEEHMRSSRLSCKLISSKHRIWVYECQHIQGSIGLIVIVNGLNYHRYSQHTIEDHLLEVAKALGVDVDRHLRQHNYNPKATWRSLTKRERDKVFHGVCRVDLSKLQGRRPLTAVNGGGRRLNRS